MNDKEWHQFLECLDTSQEWLREAFDWMDGIDGLTEAGEHSFSAAMASIDALRAAEVRYREREAPLAAEKARTERLATG
jgi:hypothetical protein